ncbi:Methyltransferase-like protein 7A [Bienertia sinuspersici]
MFSLQSVYLLSIPQVKEIQEMIQSTSLPSSIFPNPLQFPTKQTVSQFNSSVSNPKINGSRKIDSGFNLFDTQTRDKPIILQSLGFCKCGRRHFMETIASTVLQTSLPSLASEPNSSSMDILRRIHPPKSDWYEEFYASLMNDGMKAYETEIAGYKSQLFDNLKGQAEKVLELGVGTGPNLKYYADNAHKVYGVDPNRKMEKYARGAAAAAGLSPENFKFIQAVGEALPLNDASVDAVIGTLVLCSVKDVQGTLQGAHLLSEVLYFCIH